MAFEKRDLSGALFKNHKRETDNHPNAKGDCLIDGVEYWVSAWTKKDKNGNPWQSLSFTRKEQQAAPQPAQRMDPANRASMAAQAPAGVDDFDSEIPFSQHERGWVI